MTTKQFTIFTLIAVLAIFGSIRVTTVHAQTGLTPIFLGPQTSLAGCTWPTGYLSPGATFANAFALCPLNLSTGPALALAVNGGPFSIQNTAPAPPVASVFGRTGTILAAQGDYSYSQLSAPPTTLACTTASIATGSAGSLTASGCSLK